MSEPSGYLAMGGYAAFVWPAYAIAAGLMIGFAWSTWRRLRAAQRHSSQSSLQSTESKG